MNDLVLVKKVDSLQNLKNISGILKSTTPCILYLVGDCCDLFLIENCVEDDICQSSTIKILHHHHQRVSLQEELSVVDKVGMVQLLHHLANSFKFYFSLLCRQMYKYFITMYDNEFFSYHDFHQEMIFPLVI